jgi:hypothetical protein
MAENFLAFFGHSDIVLVESLGKNSTIDIAISIGEKKNLLACGFPEAALCSNVIYQNGVGASVVSNRPEIVALLAVDRHSMLVRVGLGDFDTACDIEHYHDR